MSNGDRKRNRKKHKKQKSQGGQRNRTPQFSQSPGVVPAPHIVLPDPGSVAHAPESNNEDVRFQVVHRLFAALATALAGLGAYVKFTAFTSWAKWVLLAAGISAIASAYCAYRKDKLTRPDAPRTKVERLEHTGIVLIVVACLVLFVCFAVADQYAPAVHAAGMQEVVEKLGDLTEQVSEMRQGMEDLSRQQRRALNQEIPGSEPARLPPVLHPGNAPRPELPNGGTFRGKNAVFLGTTVAMLAPAGGNVITEDGATIFSFVDTGGVLSITLNLFDRDGNRVLSVSDETKNGGNANSVYVDENNVEWPRQIGKDRIAFKGRDGVTYCDVQFLNPTTLILRGAFFTPSGTFVTINDLDGIRILLRDGRTRHIKDFFGASSGLLHLSSDGGLDLGGP